MPDNTTFDANVLRQVINDANNMATEAPQPATTNFNATPLADDLFEVLEKSPEVFVKPSYLIPSAYKLTPSAIDYDPKEVKLTDSKLIEILKQIITDRSILHFSYPYNGNVKFSTDLDSIVVDNENVTFTVTVPKGELLFSSSADRTRFLFENTCKFSSDHEGELLAVLSNLIGKKINRFMLKQGLNNVNDISNETIFDKNSVNYCTYIKNAAAYIKTNYCEDKLLTKRIAFGIRSAREVARYLNVENFLDASTEIKEDEVQEVFDLEEREGISLSTNFTEGCVQTFRMVMEYRKIKNKDKKSEEMFGEGSIDQELQDLEFDSEEAIDSEPMPMLAEIPIRDEDRGRIGVTGNTGMTGPTGTAIMPIGVNDRGPYTLPFGGTAPNGYVVVEQTMPNPNVIRETMTERTYNTEIPTLPTAPRYRVTFDRIRN